MLALLFGLVKRKSEMKKCFTDGQGRSRLLESKSQAVRNVSHIHNYLVFFSPLSEFHCPCKYQAPLVSPGSAGYKITTERWSWWICSQKGWCKCRIQELNFANSCSGSKEGKKLFQRGSSCPQFTNRPIVYTLKSLFATECERQDLVLCLIYWFKEELQQMRIAKNSNSSGQGV